MYAHDEQEGWLDGGPPDDVVDAAATLLQLLSDPTRMRILWLLSRDECDVGTLTDRVGAARPAVSQHLAKLRLAGLVQVRKSGRHSIYRTRGVHIASLLTEVFSAADHQVRQLPDHGASGT